VLTLLIAKRNVFSALAIAAASFFVLNYKFDFKHILKI